GAAIAKRGNLSPVKLQLNSGSAMVQGSKTGSQLKAVLWSSRTRHTAAAPELLRAAHDLFGFNLDDFDSRYPPAVIEAGARHLLLCLKDRDQLARMNYDLATGAKLMRDWDLATINLVCEEESGLFHSRNAFAAGGVFEDPATGAAAAALVAYLAELDGSVSRITVLQGYDMGVPCIIHAEAPEEAGGSARVEGLVREIEE
ncbi:MAG: PhzF family phenazine biosynthesis protein, partial [Maricaulis sp.]|nr:PhzF family phenazine biosynthesis protein [Maricaulis sp.]